MEWAPLHFARANIFARTNIVRSCALLLAAASCGDAAQTCDDDCGTGGSEAPTSGPGAGGSGGSPTTGTGMTSCTPGETMSCYSGPAGTQGVGTCQAGEATCVSDGSGFGACTGEVLPQAIDNCSTAADEDCSGSSPPCAPSWTHTFEIGGISQRSWDFNLTTDPSGNAIFAGSFGGDRSFGGQTLMATSDADVAFVKLDDSGTHVWSQSFPATKEVMVVSMATDASDSIVLSGSFTGTVNLGGADLTAVGGAFAPADIFLAKYDASGNHVFSKSFGTNGGDFGYSVATTPGGDIFLGANQGGAIDYGGGLVNGGGLVVVRFEPDGDHVSDRMFPNIYGAASVDASGNVYVVAVGPPHDLGGGVVGPAQRNLYAAKYDALGNHVFSHGVGVSHNSDFFELVAPLSNGTLATTGMTVLPLDFGLGPVEGGVLVSYDATGAISSRGISVYTRFGALAVGGGELRVGGFIFGASDFGGGTVNPTGESAFVARYDEDGALLDVTQFGGTTAAESASVTGLGIDPAGQSMIVAHYNGTNVTLGGQGLPASSMSARRIVVAKLP